MIAVCSPMPPMNGIGIRKPKSARLGIVCPMLAKASANRRARGLEARSKPAGMAIADAIRIAVTTRTRCSPMSCVPSSSRSSKMSLSTCRLVEDVEKRARFLVPARPEFLRAAEEYEAALMEQGDSGSQLHRFLDVMRDKDRSLAE